MCVLDFKRLRPANLVAFWTAHVKILDRSFISKDETNMTYFFGIVLMDVNDEDAQSYDKVMDEVDRLLAPYSARIKFPPNKQYLDKFFVTVHGKLSRLSEAKRLKCSQ
jgi:hypothetical protein